MQFIRNSIFTRPDTMFGVCQSLGEDLGISANWFRVGLALIVVVNFWAAFAAYGVLAVLALTSRILFPNSRTAEVEVTTSAVEAPAAQAEPKSAPVLARAA